MYNICVYKGNGLKMRLDAKSCLERIVKHGYTFKEIADDSGVGKVSLLQIYRGESSGKRVATKIRDSMVRFEKKTQEINSLIKGERHD